jgi:hypothetical protein
MVQLHEFLVPHLRELAKTEGFTDQCTLSTSVTGACDGFLGMMLRVIIEGTRAGVADKLSVLSVKWSFTPNFIPCLWNFKKNAAFPKKWRVFLQCPSVTK